MKRHFGSPTATGRLALGLAASLLAPLTASVTATDATPLTPPAADSRANADLTPAAGAPLSLAAALQRALEHNPTLRAAQGRLTAAQGRADQSRLWTNPELELSVEDWSTRRGGLNDAKKLVGLAQIVPLPGRKALDRDIGAREMQAAAAARELQQRTTARDVKVAYYGVLVATRLVATAEELVRVATASAQAARQRVAAGAAAEQEQLRAEIALEQTRAEALAARDELAAARQALAAVVGQPAVADAALTDALPEASDPRLGDTAPEAWLERHPAWLAARAQREQAELAVRRARRSALPDPRIGLAGGRAGADAGALVQVSLSFPLPVLDRGRAQQREASGQLAAATAEAVAVEQELRRAWTEAVRQLRTATEHVALHRDRILPRADAALRLVQTGFEHGKFSLVDLLDTQRTAAEARRAYQQRLLALHTAAAAVEALAGPAPAAHPQE